MTWPAGADNLYQPGLVCRAVCHSVKVRLTRIGKEWDKDPAKDSWSKAPSNAGRNSGRNTRSNTAGNGGSNAMSSTRGKPESDRRGLAGG